MKKLTIIFLLFVFASISLYSYELPKGITVTKQGIDYKINFNLPEYSFTKKYFNQSA